MVSSDRETKHNALRSIYREVSRLSHLSTTLYDCASAFAAAWYVLVLLDSTMALDMMICHTK